MFGNPREVVQTGNREDTALVHVAYFIDQLCETGGAERMLLNTIRLLPKDRFRCSVITFKLDTSLPLFQSLPCPYYVFPLRKTYDWNAFRSSSVIRDFLRRENVEIVHTFHETADLWGGFVSKIGGNRVLVSSRRDMGILRSLKHDIGYRLSNRIVDLVLTVSEEVRRFCIKADGIRPEKTATLYNGLELTKFDLPLGATDLRARLCVDTSTTIIVTVGNIRAVKGIDVLVKAAEIVTRNIPNVLFLIVGRNSDPEYLENVEREIRKVGISRNIRFWGESEEVTSILRQSDIFFLPSRSEGFSNALIEAMACSLPCVATNVGGNGEAVVHEESGYIVANEDAQDAASRILSLISDPKSAQRMGQAGREIVERRFTAGAMISELVGHYDRLLSARRN
jgi:glycosyltransferase involved in cell wall biosynthesis